ncbi:GH39 family glycosyl hydrolase [Kiritimatiella glycovorans]|uniref:Beta-xylosidase n=1 Tax=Kiritimatiella glycovorans TaxID=1307763 RepID=A0A0G3EK20_9BACT|nr:hypothetical protein [Kiritimatiella glycovorans]AKJ64484.1 Beta-xylosidase [Kiritimatiella glycovorans]
MKRRIRVILTGVALACGVFGAEAEEEILALGTMDGFYRNTAVLDRTLAKAMWLRDMPDWLQETDFPYPKKEADIEAPFADHLSVVRLLGGWHDPKLPPDRHNDPNDLVGRNDSGELFYRWDLLKARLDPYVTRGYDLTLVLDNVPYCLPDEPRKGTYGQAAPPSDFNEWQTFIREMCLELKRLYGASYANRLRFRMGTEMQDRRRFDGTYEEFLQTYDHAAAAVKEVLPGAKFGPFNRSMPHGNFDTFEGLVEGNVSIFDLAEHCANGTNRATGEIGAPFDFLARSFYYFSSNPKPGKFGNIHPDQRVPEFERLWETIEGIAPKHEGISREVHEYGPHLNTEGGVYGLDTGARGAAQNLHTIAEMKEVGCDRLWHWGIFEWIDGDHVLMQGHAWLYHVFERMRGGALYTVPVTASEDHGHTQKAMLSVKRDEAILVVANWNVDREKHESGELIVDLPGEVLPTRLKAAEQLVFNRETSVYDVIRRDLEAAGLLSEKHREHRGEPATVVSEGGYTVMAADRAEGRTFVRKNWDRYLGMMKDSLTRVPFDGMAVVEEGAPVWRQWFGGDPGSTMVTFHAECPSVTVVVFR